MLISINSLIMIYSLIKLTDEASDNTGGGAVVQIGFLINANLPQLSFLKWTH